MSYAANPLDGERLPDVQLPPGHTWQHVRKLGSGGEGAAYLWAHLDANQRVVERLVIKNTTHVHPLHQIVQDGPHKGEWLEVYVQQRLAPSGSTNPCTVPVLAAQKIPGTEDSWRAYMPFYSKGDFERVMKDHYVVRPLPEPFLWFVFHRLAKAAVAMDETFREEGKDGPVIVHQDIKPENIFMGHPGSLGRDADYIAYPVAVVGDFGVCYLTPEDDSWRQKLRGTLGYMAPELDTGLPAKAKARYDVPPGSKTNVWQFANCILLAMTANRGGKPRPDGLAYQMIAKYDWYIQNGTWSGYSQDLIGVVEWCLRDKLEHRPSPQQLLAEIERLVPQHADGMDRWGTLSWVK